MIKQLIFLIIVRLNSKFMNVILTESRKDKDLQYLIEYLCFDFFFVIERMFAVLKTIDDRRIFKIMQLFQNVLKAYESLKVFVDEYKS